MSTFLKCFLPTYLELREPKEQVSKKYLVPKRRQCHFILRTSNDMIKIILLRHFMDKLADDIYIESSSLAVE
jgi:hypothetical protein